MKHVGLNVAADPFFSSSMIGLAGGLVVVSADDPAMHSSQDEQDNRNYAKFAQMAMIEPSDSRRGAAVRQDRLRAERALRHGGAVPDDHPDLARQESGAARGAGGAGGAGGQAQARRRNSMMMPHNAIPRHAAVEQRVLELAEYAETAELNSVEMGDTRVGIVTSGSAYGSAKEALPAGQLPEAGHELSAAEEAHRRLPRPGRQAVYGRGARPLPRGEHPPEGVQVDGGKDILPLCGEINPGLVARLLAKAGVPGVDEGLLVEVPERWKDLPDRPPTLCPGCSHRGVFVALPDCAPS